MLISLLTIANFSVYSMDANEKKNEAKIAAFGDDMKWSWAYDNEKATLLNLDRKL